MTQAIEPEEPGTQAIDPATLAAIDAELQATMARQIRSPRLELGLLRTALHVVLLDGSSRSLWWPAHQFAGEEFAEELPELCPHLGDQLVFG